MEITFQKGETENNDENEFVYIFMTLGIVGENEQG